MIDRWQLLTVFSDAVIKQSLGDQVALKYFVVQLDHAAALTHNTTH